MRTKTARILHTTINIPFEKAYGFAREPEDFPRWAEGLSGSIKKTGKGWVAKSPMGAAVIRFSEPSAHGVLDHWVTLPGKPDN
jgi:hypothetical protein